MATRVALLMFLCVAAAGCVEDTGIRGSYMYHHEVCVPPQFRGARQLMGDVSDHERYLERYEDGWWHCVSLYVADINHQTTLGDKAASGWPSAVEGFWNGYEDAESQIHRNIHRFGKDKAHEYLMRLWESP